MEVYYFVPLENLNSLFKNINNSMSNTNNIVIGSGKNYLIKLIRKIKQLFLIWLLWMNSFINMLLIYNLF